MYSSPAPILLSLFPSSLSPVSSREEPPRRALDVRICEELRERMLNKCAYQENCSNSNAFASIGDFRMRGSSISDGVVCPKPRRICLFNPLNYQMEVCDSRAGSELLDMILTKGSYGAEKPNHQVPSSPPFFMGSPPSRSSNPVIQDVHFGIDKPSPFIPAPEALPSSQRKNGGYARVKFGQKPAAVRIEGFNCRGNCSISAVA